LTHILAQYIADEDSSSESMGAGLRGEDLRPDPDARSGEEWIQSLLDSGRIESLQSAGNTAKHHNEIDGGSTTEDDLSLPSELEDLWPETEDRSSEEEWIKAFLASPEASYLPPDTDMASTRCGVNWR
ncbi:hypothetical protein FOZ62_007518, partial [Perkinsus olseni]